MSGLNTSTKTVFSSGSARLDGVMIGEAWNTATLLYSLPRSNAEYGFGYGANEDDGHFGPASQLESVTTAILDKTNGNSADDGFAVEGFTDQNIVKTLAGNAAVRVNQTASDPYFYGTAWGYYPGFEDTSGDVWLSSVIYDYGSPTIGQYDHYVVMHEIGHALGLKHGHEADGFGTLPRQFDAMEFSVMTYRSYINSGVSESTNDTNGYAQSWMMSDIAALQHMYGADFTTNSGDTVYSWTPGSGDTRVDGGVGIDPLTNTIFATIWDGGGRDTYDLSQYTTNLMLDLAPGGHSMFSSAQLAGLGDGQVPQGNIYNALLYQSDLRSLIENAKGGSGNDLISGNEADNRLTGNAGNDRMNGLAGDDTLLGQSGADVLNGNAGDDTLDGGAGRDVLRGGGQNDTLIAGGDFDRLFGAAGNDKLVAGTGNDVLFGGAGQDKLNGQAGNDTMNGGAGNDLLIGGAGRDIMTGGAGRDTFQFLAASDSPIGAQNDIITDFTSGQDRIDLRAFDLDVLAFSGGFSQTTATVVVRTLNDEVRIFADTDANGQADMRITLDGTDSITRGDFLL
ncbi:MAG: M10 family metallopeptidase [Sedimentitalea sp.]